MKKNGFNFVCFVLFFLLMPRDDLLAFRQEISGQFLEDHLDFTLMSPWLQIDRPHWKSLDETINSDIVIIGGGISGISTLYFLLTLTDKHVVLVEKDQIASGATGNNAGTAVANIERSISELVSEFGLEKTQAAFDEVNIGWDLLLDVIEKTEMQEDFFPITDAARGFTSVEILLESLAEEQIKKQVKSTHSQYLVSDHLKTKIPEEFHQDLQFVPPEEILRVLRCLDPGYIAAAILSPPFYAARLNSAKLCYQMLDYLQKNYAERFSIYEKTEVMHVDVFSDRVTISCAKGTIDAHDVIICTNGYKNVSLWDRVKQIKINTIQDSIISREGVLIAYQEENKANDGFASLFLDDRDIYADVPYFYTSQSPFVQGDPSFILIGGPENDDVEQLDLTLAQSHLEIFKKFTKNAYGVSKNSFDYFWGGIMGYTPSGLRWVGKDPSYPHLWYNLGCNGIGIVPAIGGAEKIAQQFNGKVFPPSIFDPSQ